MSAEPPTYANCPQCRLSIRVRALSVAPTSCPRCLAKRHEIVELFLSPQPFRLLSGKHAQPARVK